MCPSCGMPLTIRSDLGFCFKRRFEIVFALTSQFKNSAMSCDVSGDGESVDGPHGLGVTAEDFGLRGPRGWAFRGISLDAEPGSLIAIEGPSGSGRTCLLLALTGRMKATEGTAAVGPSRLPKRM